MDKTNKRPGKKSWYETMDNRQRHFVLVHGAGYGAWCWYKVQTLLELAGHRVTALDMAASGTHPKQANDVTSFSDYIEPLAEFMASLPSEERVILVGHSAGGGCISVAMEKFPQKVSVAVFASAIMPAPNLSFPALCKEFIRRLDPKVVSDQLSPPEDKTLGKSLRRPYPSFKDEELFEKETRLSKERFGSVARIYIECDQDHVYKDDFLSWMIQNNPPDELRHITDSDHMLMFSATKRLFSSLQDIAGKYY